MYIRNRSIIFVSGQSVTRVGMLPELEAEDNLAISREIGYIRRTKRIPRNTGETNFRIFKILNPVRKYLKQIIFKSKINHRYQCALQILHNSNFFPWIFDQLHEERHAATLAPGDRVDFVRLIDGSVKDGNGVIRKLVKGIEYKMHIS